MFEFLSDPEVMKPVGFYASGAATVIGGLWVAYTKLFVRANGSSPEATQNAEHGIAAGRDVEIHGSVSISSTPKNAWVLSTIGVIGLIGSIAFGGDTAINECVAENSGSMTNGSMSVSC